MITKCATKRASANLNPQLRTKMWTAFWTQFRSQCGTSCATPWPLSRTSRHPSTRNHQGPTLQNPGRWRRPEHQQARRRNPRTKGPVPATSINSAIHSARPSSGANPLAQPRQLSQYLVRQVNIQQGKRRRRVGGMRWQIAPPCDPPPRALGRWLAADGIVL